MCILSLQHMQHLRYTFTTSRSNIWNISLERLKHLKHDVAMLPRPTLWGDVGLVYTLAAGRWPLAPPTDSLAPTRGPGSCPSVRSAAASPASLLLGRSHPKTSAHGGRGTALCGIGALLGKGAWHGEVRWAYVWWHRDTNVSASVEIFGDGKDVEVLLGLSTTQA